MRVSHLGFIFTSYVFDTCNSKHTGITDKKFKILSLILSKKLLRFALQGKGAPFRQRPKPHPSGQHMAPMPKHWSSALTRQSGAAIGANAQTHGLVGFTSGHLRKKKM